QWREKPVVGRLFDRPAAQQNNPGARLESPDDGSERVGIELDRSLRAEDGDDDVAWPGLDIRDVIAVDTAETVLREAELPADRGALAGDPDYPFGDPEIERGELINAHGSSANQPVRVKT